MVFSNKNIHHKMLASHFKHFDSFQIFRFKNSKKVITFKVFRKPIIVKSGIRRRSLAKAKRKINSLIISVTSNSWAVAGIQAPILDYETERDPDENIGLTRYVVLRLARNIDQTLPLSRSRWNAHLHLQRTA